MTKAQRFVALDDAVVVIADFEVEVIQEPEQGPPGPIGPQGPPGAPGGSLDGVLLVAGHQTTTGGFCFTSYNLGTVSSGTVTPNAMNGNYQYYTNNGAHVFAAPAVDCAFDVLMTNGASAGVVTFSGFTVTAGRTGDALTTTNGDKFLIGIRRINAIAIYVIKAL